MQDEIELLILENLIHNEDYARKALPFLKEEYFPDSAYQTVFTKVRDYINKYNSIPTQSELLIELKNAKGLNQGDFEVSVDVVNGLQRRATAPAMEWLLENTESFCRDAAIYNTIVEAAELIEGDKNRGTLTLGAIPEKLQDALGISFDTTVGTDYDSAADRWERRKQRKVDKISFSLEVMNEATNGGMNIKTISCIAAGTGAGKSAFMCAQAAHSILNGVDTLYITLEMDEDSIADRIDANILGIDLDDIATMSKDSYTTKLNKKLSGDKIGRLIIKEYPTSCAGVLEFRALLNELKLKKNFIPRFIIVDYLNICSSARFKAGVVNSYTLVKAIAEELRGMAKEFNAAILTGTQLNRDGVDNENVSLKEISESSGLSHTVDLLFALMRTEELDKLNQVMVKQLKNRFGDMAKKLRFVFGVDRAKFRYFDVDNAATPQEDGKIFSDETTDQATGEITFNGSFGVRKKPKNFKGIQT